MGRRFNSTETAATAAAQSVAPIKTEIAAVAPEPALEVAQKVVETVSPDQIGYFQSVGLAQTWWWPPDFFAHIMEMVHHYSGMPWWMTISAVTVGLRLAMFPLYLKSSNATAKMTRIKPELNKLMKEYQLSDDPAAAQMAMTERRKLLDKYNIKTRHLMLPIATIPLFLGVFGAIQGMSRVPVAGMMSEGLGWFTNLAAPDPYLGLQLLTAGFYAASFKFGGETGSNTLSPAMRKLFTYMPFIAVPMTMSLPAGTCFYFALSGVMSVGQTALMRNPAFRRALKLEPIVKPPPTEEDAMSVFQSLRSSLDKAKQRAEAQAKRDNKTKQEWDQFRAAQDREFARIKPKNNRK